MANTRVSPRRGQAAAARLLGPCLSLAACSHKAEPEPEPIIPVQVADVQASAVERTITADGILYPITQSAVMPKISAPVREIHVNRGDHVHRGQLLAVLENRDLAAAAVENQGLLKQAQPGVRSTTGGTPP